MSAPPPHSFRAWASWRRPSSTIRILLSAESSGRVARRMPRTIASAVGLGGGLNHDRRTQAERGRWVLSKIDRAIAWIPVWQKTDIPDLHSNIANIHGQNVARFTKVLPPLGAQRGEARAGLRGGLRGIF